MISTDVSDVESGLKASMHCLSKSGAIDASLRNCNWSKSCVLVSDVNFSDTILSETASLMILDANPKNALAYLLSANATVASGELVAKRTFLADFSDSSGS